MAPPRGRRLDVNLADGRDRAVIDMHDEARRTIEQLVVGIVEAAEKLGFKSDGMAAFMPG